MSNIFQRLAKALAGIFRALDNIEGAVVMLLAAAVVVGLLVVLTIKLFKLGNLSGAVLVACLWGGVIASVIRDILRGKFGAVSWVVMVLWLLTTIAITASTFL